MSKSIYTTYLDNAELAKAIDEAAEASGKSTSKLIADVLMEHFLSPNSFRLITEKAELNGLLKEQNKKETDFLDIQEKVKSKEISIARLEDEVVEDWIGKQVRDTILDVEDPEERIGEFNSVVSSIPHPWLKERVEDYLSNGGLSKIQRELGGAK